MLGGNHYSHGIVAQWTIPQSESRAPKYSYQSRRHPSSSIGRFWVVSQYTFIYSRTWIQISCKMSHFGTILDFFPYNPMCGHGCLTDQNDQYFSLPPIVHMDSSGLQWTPLDSIGLYPKLLCLERTTYGTHLGLGV